MPFNKETDAHLTVSKKHRDMLRTIAAEQRRDMRPCLELMIEREFNAVIDAKPLKLLDLPAMKIAPELGDYTNRDVSEMRIRPKGELGTIYGVKLIPEDEND